MPRHAGKRFLFSYIFLWVFMFMEHLCRPSEASTQFCAIPGGYPPQDWQSLPCAGEELDSNPGLLICRQVRYHWATSPPFEPPLLLLSHLSSWLSHLSSHWATSPPKACKYFSGSFGHHEKGTGNSKDKPKEYWRPYRQRFHINNAFSVHFLEALRV